MARQRNVTEKCSPTQAAKMNHKLKLNRARQTIITIAKSLLVYWVMQVNDMQTTTTKGSTATIYSN